MKHFTHGEAHPNLFKIGDRIFNSSYEFIISNIIPCSLSASIIGREKYNCQKCRKCVEKWLYVSSKSGKMFCSEANWNILE
jgi:hypothetical protein